MTLWSVGRHDLQLTDEEFWRLSPRQFHALLERFEQEQVRRDKRAGIIAATVANSVRDAKKRRKPFEPGDFIYLPKEAKKTQTWQQQLSMVEMLNAAFNGRDLRSTN